jgi:phenylacetate-CoA ligase
MSSTVVGGRREADLYTRLASGVLFPFHEALKRHSTVAVRRWLEKTEWYSPQELAALQAQRLRALIERAAVKVPYYRDLFADRRIAPSTIRSAADLARIPFLTKPLIRAAADRLRASDAGRLEKAATSGSTGEPLRFELGLERVSHDVAAKWRATRWWGVDIGDPEIVIWTSPIEGDSQDIVRHVRDRLLRSTFIDARDLSDHELEAILGRIEQIGPRMLFGYTSAVARLASFAHHRGWRLRGADLRVVFVTSAKLLAEQRAQMQEVFGCPVANGYGGRDAGFVAHECPAGGMHITEEDVVVEIVNDEGEPLAAGQAGEVVVTNLASGDFPFIRYRTGDRAVLDSKACPCGRSSRLIGSIEGRTNDLLVGPGGRVMHHTGISNVLKDVPGLQNYKIIQEREDLIRVLVVTEGPLDERHSAGAQRALKSHLGEEVRVDFERVADIPLERAGKHRYIVNRVLESRAARAS